MKDNKDTLPIYTSKQLEECIEAAQLKMIDACIAACMNLKDYSLPTRAAFAYELRKLK